MQVEAHRPAGAHTDPAALHSFLGVAVVADTAVDRACFHPDNHLRTDYAHAHRNHSVHHEDLADRILAQARRTQPEYHSRGCHRMWERLVLLVRQSLLGRRIGRVVVAHHTAGVVRGAVGEGLRTRFARRIGLAEAKSSCYGWALRCAGLERWVGRMWAARCRCMCRCLQRSCGCSHSRWKAYYAGLVSDYSCWKMWNSDSQIHRP